MAGSLNLMGKIVSKAMNSEKYDFKRVKKFEIQDRDKGRTGLFIFTLSRYTHSA